MIVDGLIVRKSENNQGAVFCFCHVMSLESILDSKDFNKNEEKPNWSLLPQEELWSTPAMSEVVGLSRR